ncbi:MAG TPA: formate dehydrogenase subunit alpha [Methanocorpusculum sp.]|nr:formate dehydrogenase subunit alpha [Methanocorpusculum sp.]
MDIKYVTTTCPYCGAGCTFNLVVKDGKVIGTAPAQRGPVNQGKLCPKGVFGFEFINSPDRLTTPLIKDKKTGEQKTATWEEALKVIAENFAKYKPEEFAVISSARCCNEDNYAMQKFARIVLKTPNIDHCARLCHAPTVAGLAKVFGSGASTNSFDDLAIADLVFIIGSNNLEAHPLAGRRIMEAKKRGAHIIVCDPRVTPTAKQAEMHMQHFPGTDIQLLNCLMKYIIENDWIDHEFVEKRCNGYEDLKKCVTQDKYNWENTSAITGVPVDQLKTALEWLHECQHKTAFVHCLGITQHTVGVDNVRSIAHIQTILGNIGKPGCGVNALRGQNNVQGSCDMGALPNVYSGYQSVMNPDAAKKVAEYWGIESVPQGKLGLHIPEMLETLYEHPDQVKCMYLLGENPVMSDPNSKMVEQAMENCEFLVVQDIFNTETSRYADVVLPGACYAEEDGTQTNAERRVQRFRKAQNPPGEAKQDWEIMKMIAEAMGYGKYFPWEKTEDVFNEMRGITPQYAGITYAKLDGDGIQWPCPTEDHPGTPILHITQFNGMPEGKACLEAIEHRPPAEVIDAEYPFWLTTGATIWHWPSGSMTRRCEQLDRDCPTAWLEMNAADAEKLGVKDGEKVILYSRRGEVEVATRVFNDIKPGVFFMPFHFIEARANLVTNTAYDPVSRTPEYKVCAVNIKRKEA